MIFKVPEDYKGSFTLQTIGRALWAGVRISIVPPDLYASDVKSAIKKKALVPLKKEKYDEISDLSSEAMLVNRTDRKLVLGTVVLKPWASLVVNKHICNTPEAIGAENSGFIHIVTDEKTYDNQQSLTENLPDGSEDVSKEANQKIDEENEEIIKKAKSAKIWDFQKQEAENADLVPRSEDVVRIDEDKDPKDVDFIDSSDKDKKSKKKVAKKKKSKKKSTKKKTAKKKTKKKSSIKKDTTAKKKEDKLIKRKNKTIEPVGIKKESNPEEVIPMDSRGNIISEKPSDVLEGMIGELINDVDFVDKEQAEKKKQDRGGLDDLDW